MANRLQITELDFDQIKNNLKAFLQQQDMFTDYDFTGSGLNILLDILAFNTHYQAYYLNMIANEAFLDTALLRDSVVSHAKALGYTPQSKKSSSAIINFQVDSTNNNIGKLTIPRGYSFLSNQIDGKSYNFIVLEDTTVTKANTIYLFENLSINEGQLSNYSYVHNQASNPKQIFDIPDENVDIDTLVVSVSPAQGNTDITYYNKALDLTDITATSEVYFVQEARNGKFQIYFGNDVIGKAIPDGGVVYINYLITNNYNANKANNFIGTSVFVDSLSETLTNLTVIPISAAKGGLGNETVDSIKYSAPLAYASQNRLVTYKDYELIIRKNYPNIDSISVWGGEDEFPPVYGKVFISLKPSDNYYISETEKDNIIANIISPKSMVTVKTEIRDPDFLYILVDVAVQYDPKRTLNTTDTIKLLIVNAINTYNTTYLNKFEAKFVQSKLEETINGIDLNSIIGCKSIIKVQKKIDPTLNITNNYEIDLSVALAQKSSVSKLTSSEFYVYDSNNNLCKVIIEEVPNSSTGINSISIINSGIGYTSPTVTINGDGIGAKASATVSNGRIEKINILSPGIDYNKSTITITDSTGYGASAVPVLNTKIGILRTVYYNNLGERIIVNSNIGTIDYSTGSIILKDIKIISVDTIDGLLKIECPIQVGIIQTVRNSILTIDNTDISSITINLETV